MSPRALLSSVSMAAETRAEFRLSGQEIQMAICLASGFVGAEVRLKAGGGSCNLGVSCVVLGSGDGGFIPCRVKGDVAYTSSTTIIMIQSILPLNFKDLGGSVDVMMETCIH